MRSVVSCGSGPRHSNQNALACITLAPATSQLRYPMAQQPRNASVCIDAGNPHWPRARRHPQTAVGEDLRRAGGICCGFCRWLANSPRAFAPSRTPHWQFTFLRTRLRQSGDLRTEKFGFVRRYSCCPPPFVIQNSIGPACDAPASYRATESGSAAALRSYAVFGPRWRRGFVSNILRVRCAPALS